MMVYLRPQWYFVIVLLGFQNSVAGDDKANIHSLAERIKRETFGNDLTDKSQDDATDLQTDTLNKLHYGDLGESGSYNPGFANRPSGDNYDPMLQLISETDSQNLPSYPLDSFNSEEYFPNYHIKQDQEIDGNDRINLDELKNFDNEDDIVLVRRKMPTFSDDFMFKQQHQHTNSNNNILKRTPAQLFVRRAPHYSHSFVGKRSVDGNDYNDKAIHSEISDKTGFANSAGTSFRFPTYRDYLESTELKSDPNFQDVEISSVHNLVKRATDDEKRGLAFGHNFVGKRGPRFGHSFVGKRGPRFGHSFVGKRGPRFGHSFVGKRGPRFGHSFVGKRGPRFGHSFVGKREFDSSEDIETPLIKDENEDDMGMILTPEELVEQTDFLIDEESPDESVESPDKRQQRPTLTPSNVVQKRPGFGHSFVGKRGLLFGDSFVGKRPSFGHSFVGKRGLSFGHSFVGKRPSFGHSFVGKRPSFGHSFVGKRPSFGHSFVGKRPSFGHSFVGKRSPSFGHSFVGKRGPSFGHSFVGKRGPSFGHSFVGKRGPSFGHSFVGKRGPSFGHSFVGKRGPSFGHSFVGKRGPSFGHSFVGKRGPSFGHSFVGKRGPSFGHSFVGKRPGFRHNFVGKRGDGFDSNLLEKQDADNVDVVSIENEVEDNISREIATQELLASQKADNDSTSPTDTIKEDSSERNLNTSPQNFGSIDNDLVSYSQDDIGKRAPGFGHNFVGKRAPEFGHNFVGKRTPGFGHNFVGKRAPGFGHNFVGKRGDEVVVFDDGLLEENLKSEDILKLMNLIQTEESESNQDVDSVSDSDSSQKTNI